MPTFIHTADGFKKTFKCPSDSTNKVIRVNGATVPTKGVTLSAVTLIDAPQRGDIVEVFTAIPEGTDTNALPFTLNFGITPKLTPVVQYFGEGAEDMGFAIDPTALKMNVYAETVHTDY